MLDRRVRAIAFDAVGTLIHPDPPAPQVYAEVGRRYGSWYAPEVIAGRFAAAFLREEERDHAGGLRTSETRERERWRTIVAAVLDDAADQEACYRELFLHFRQPRAWRCAPETARVLERLAADGYRLAIASNYDERLRSVAAGMSELRVIHHLVISAEIGWRKPAPQFYSALCRTLGLSPCEVLFVGDDVENDYEGARAAGLLALLFDPQNRAPAAVARLTRLDELLTP